MPARALQRDVGETRTAGLIFRKTRSEGGLMGLDANYPAVTMNDPNGHVIVYNQDHVPIGRLGPTPFEGPSVNVICKIRQWDYTYWYRLMNPDGWDLPATRAYVSADETHVINPGKPWPIPECANGCRRRARPVATSIGLAAGVVAAIAAWRRRRR
jgi:hypothetical protein